MNRFGHLAAIGLLGGLLAGACGGGDDGGGGTANAETFCKSVCERQNVCDRSRDTLTCINDCRNETATTFPKLRGEVSSMLTSCVNNKDCTTLTTTSTLLLQCAAEARATLAPSTMGQSFCTELVTAFDRCGSEVSQVETITRAECLEITKLNNDRALSDARMCTQKPCRDIATCLDVTLAFTGTSSSGGGGSSPGGGGSSPGGGGSNPGGGGSSPGGAVMCGGATAENGCQTCVFTSCCGSLMACASNAACASLFDCILECPDNDTACEDNCANTYPDGISLINAYAGCFTNMCSAACGGGGGGSSGGGQSG